MEHAGIPVLRDVVITNGSGERMSNLLLHTEILPQLGAVQTQALDDLGPGQEAEIDVVDLRFEPGRMRTVAEREQVELRLRVSADGKDVAQIARRLDILAFNEWPGTRAPLELLACFVTPNAPDVRRLLGAIRAELATAIGDGSLDGYQGRSTARARAQTTAVYDAFRKLGLGYAQGLASFERTGQKVRFADDIFRDRLANCLDASLAVAALLEQIGLRPLLILQEGHAYTGVWLIEERFPEGVVEDPERLSTLIELGHLVAFDPTLALKDPSAQFVAAESAARRRLAEGRSFVAALDVHVLRDAKFLPLPLRAEHGESAPLEELGDADIVPAVSGAGAGQRREDRQAAPSVTSPVASRFVRWKERLLDLTLRNKLLNFRIDARGALPLAVPDIARFEDLLAANKSFEIAPEPQLTEADPRDTQLLSSREPANAQALRRLEELGRGIVHTPLPPDELWKTATHLERTARTDLEEGGASTLFASIGLLSWIDAKQNRRLAPLLLYPIELRFDRQLRRVRFRKLDEDPVINQTLLEKLRRDFDIDVAALAQLEPDDSGVDIPLLLRKFREAIQRVPHWKVLDAAHLGHFTFTKFLMWKDLNDNADVLLRNPVVGHIARSNGFGAGTEVAAIEPEDLDAQIAPADLPLVVDADSTQAAAVVTALQSTGLILQGPPGTGKSQTITNLIAAAVARGKTVLFVSEKMAALDVVHRRLVQVGLGDFCLELHSHKANKKEVIEAFRKSLERGRRTQVRDWSERSQELQKLRSHLNALVRELHRQTPLGLSFYDASARILDLAGAPDTDLRLERAADLIASGLAEMKTAVRAFSLAAHSVDPVAEHPWRGCQPPEWRASDEAELPKSLANALSALANLTAAAKDLAAVLHAPPPASATEAKSLLLRARAVIAPLQELCSALDSGPVPAIAFDVTEWAPACEGARRYAGRRAEVTEKQARLAARWNEMLYELDLEALHNRFVRWATAFFLFAWIFLFGARRQLLLASRTPRLPSNVEIARDLAAVRRLGVDRAELAELEAKLVTQFADFAGTFVKHPESIGNVTDRAARVHTAYRSLQAEPGWQALQTAPPDAWPQLLAALQAKSQQLEDSIVAAEALVGHVGRVTGAASALRSLDDQSIATAFIPQLSRWRDNVRLFRPWCQFLAARSRLLELGLATLVTEHETGRIARPTLADAFERSALEQWRTAWLDRAPILRDFNGDFHRHDIEQFRALDRAQQALSQQYVLTRLEAALPRLDLAAKGSELETLLRETRKKTRHLAIRKLLAATTALRKRLKPCFLMSPLSVAQYLPPDAAFDLVVFDEASQIETHDAIGAIARGSQVVVVGDSKQLPPTRFFSRKVDDEDAAPNENDVEDLESILDEAAAKRIPQRSLGWHYRSKHDALIEFSNREYYGNELQVFPAANRQASDLGVVWHRIADGVYHSGGGEHARTNPREAEVLVDYLVSALLRHRPEDRTFGVVTFSMTQRDRVLDLLDAKRKELPALERHFSGPEKVFVKNLENVQGDERDEILFSVGYAPDERGKLRHHFGPLSNSGGERRLNVAITRARAQLRVFSTLTHDAIDASRTHARGALHLREFLRFAAERGTPRLSVAVKPEAESGFEREVYDFLTHQGYQVHTKVGCGQYRLDFAIVSPSHPGRYALGVELDGMTYSSAHTACDRDRLRAEVLQRLGWRLHRVWSLDWYRDRDAAREKLSSEVQRAVVDAESVLDDDDLVVTDGAENDQASDTDTDVLPDDALTPGPPTATVSFAPPSITTTEGIGQLYSAAVLSSAWGGRDEFFGPSATMTLRSRIIQMVTAEAPVHIAEVAKRVAACWGIERCTARVSSRIAQVVSMLERNGELFQDQHFLWKSSDQQTTHFLFRPAGPNGVARDPLMVAAEEIASAMLFVLEQNGALERDELIRATGRLFGLSRVRAPVAERLSVGLERLVRSGECRLENGRIAPTSSPRPEPKVAPPASTPAPQRADPAHATQGPSPRSAQVVQKLRQSAAFNRHVPEPHRGWVLDLVDLLLASNGRASFGDIARRVQQPAFRGGGRARMLSEHLNVDQYEVIQFDEAAQCVVLDDEKLVQVFGCH